MTITIPEEAFKLLQSAAGQMSYNPKETSNRRGSFPTVAHGISFGGGQQVSLVFSGPFPSVTILWQEPRHLRHESKEKEEALESLMKQKAIQRVCGFASGGHLL
jgi:hypothetical protein